MWQKARAFASEIYRITDGFPKAELYGLTSQLRRAAVSVASNIAEGQGRIPKGEFRQFLGQARGSLLEVETQAAIALDLCYLSADDFQTLEKASAEIQKSLNGLIASLKASRNE